MNALSLRDGFTPVTRGPVLRLLTLLPALLLRATVFGWRAAEPRLLLLNGQLAGWWVTAYVGCALVAVRVLSLDELAGLPCEVCPPGFTELLGAPSLGEATRVGAVRTSCGAAIWAQTAVTLVGVETDPELVCACLAGLDDASPVVVGHTDSMRMGRIVQLTDVAGRYRVLVREREPPRHTAKVEPRELAAEAGAA